jgi:hypothetical protein
MAGRPTQQKRLREQAKQQKQKDKAERRAERQREKESRGGGASGVDPDLAGIVPGPQPLPEWMGQPGAPGADDDD